MTTDREGKSGNQIWKIFLVFFVIWSVFGLVSALLSTLSKRSADSECRQVFGGQAKTIGNGSINCWVDYVVKDLPDRD